MVQWLTPYVYGWAITKTKFSTIFISLFISLFCSLVACSQILTIFCYNSIYLLSDSDLLHYLLEMPALDRNAKVACDNCATLVSKQNLAKHKKKCSVGTLYCSKCSNFSTKSQKVLNYHIAKKHGTSKPKTTHTCKVCKEEFAGFYALRQHKSKMHGLKVKKTDSSSLVNDIDDDSLKEELLACEHFLVDSEFERGRH